MDQISSEDIHWEGEDPGISHHGGYGGSGRGMNRTVGRDGGPGAGRGRGMLKGQSRKDFLPSQNGIGKKGSDDIQLLHTDTLIKEVATAFISNFTGKFYSICSVLTNDPGQVERVFSASHPDPQEIEKAKKVLKVRNYANLVVILVSPLVYSARMGCLFWYRNMNKHW